MKLSQLLDTKDIKTQEQRVEQLLLAVQHPPVTVLVRFNPLDGRVFVASGQQEAVEIDQVIQILSTARDQLIQEAAIARARAQEQQASAADPEAAREA
jgi:uncharacterized radical SAM superfamily protein